MKGIILEQVLGWFGGGFGWFWVGFEVVFLFFWDPPKKVITLCLPFEPVDVIYIASTRDETRPGASGQVQDHQEHHQDDQEQLQDDFYGSFYRI